MLYNYAFLGLTHVFEAESLQIVAAMAQNGAKSSALRFAFQVGFALITDFNKLNWSGYCDRFGVFEVKPVPLLIVCFINNM